MRARDDAQLDRRRRVDVGGTARRDVVAERRRPRTGVQHVARRERAGAEPGQFVGGAAAEPLGPEEPAGHRQVAAATAVLAADLEHLARRPTAATARPGPRRRRRGPRARRRPRPHGTRSRQRNRVPPPVSSSAPAPAAFPAKRLASSNDTGSAGPAAGTPTAATDRRPPSCRTARSPGRRPRTPPGRPAAGTTAVPRPARVRRVRPRRPL